MMQRAFRYIDSTILMPKQEAIITPQAKLKMITLLTSVGVVKVSVGMEYSNLKNIYNLQIKRRNVSDDDVIKCLKMLTFVPMSEINELAKLEGSELNKAKEILAYQLTELVHGEEEAKKAETAAKSIFGGGGTENMPETALEAGDFKEDGTIDLISILVKAGLVPSRGEGRRAIEQNGVSVNGEKVTDIHASYDKGAFAEEFVVRRGKKNFRKIVL